MLHLILVCLWAFLTLALLGIPILLVSFLIGLLSPSLKDKIIMRWVVVVTSGITFLSGERIVAEGTENIPKNSSVLYISNHRSFYDIFTAYRFFKGCCGCVAKIEWKKIPVLRQWMEGLHCTFLDRSSPRAGLKIFAVVTEELRNGRSFWVCPEGTRSHGDELLPFHEGSFRPAFQTGRPILPFVLTRTDDIFEKHLPWVKPATVHIRFLPPIPTEGLSKAEQKALVGTVRDQIQAAYDELKDA